MDLAQKTPKIYNCELCDYHTNDMKDYTKHLATDKHIGNDLARNGPETPRQIPPTYTCELCDYYTYHANDYRKHLTTNKHISKTKLPDKSQTNPGQIPDKRIPANHALIIHLLRRITCDIWKPKNTTIRHLQMIIRIHRVIITRNIPAQYVIKHIAIPLVYGDIRKNVLRK